MRGTFRIAIHPVQYMIERLIKETDNLLAKVAESPSGLDNCQQQANREEKSKSILQGCEEGFKEEGLAKKYTSCTAIAHIFKFKIKFI